MLRAAALTAIAIATIGCGAGSPTGELPPAVFPAEALTTQSTDGGLTVAVWSSPQPPSVGLAVFRFRFTDAAGTPVDGLSIDVLPWMPAHGHGGSTHPTAMATGPGEFLVQPVSFFMSGGWQLRTAVGGALSDEVTVGIDVP
jgi:hypothetical protein